MARGRCCDGSGSSGEYFEVLGLDEYFEVLGWVTGVAFSGVLGGSGGAAFSKKRVVVRVRAGVRIGCYGVCVLGPVRVRV